MRILRRVADWALGPSDREESVARTLELCKRALRRHRDAIDYLAGNVADVSVVGASRRGEQLRISVELDDDQWFWIFAEIYGDEHPITERFRARVRVAASALDS